MGLGYEGYISLQVDAIADVALGTGGGVPESRQRLESSSGYGGRIKTPVSEMGIGLPHNYDWSSYDGSMDFDVHEDFLTNQIIPWIFDRQKGAIVNVQTRADNVQTFPKCYWNSINLSASEGGLLTGSIGFVGMDRSVYTRGGDYIGNKTGGNTLCAGGSPVFPTPLQLGVTIPYWNTFVDIDASLVEFTSWSLDFNQDVVKFFGCNSNTNVQEPSYVAVGPMSITFTGDYMFVGAASFLSPDTLTSLYVTMGGEQIKLEDLELLTDTDVLQGQDAIVPVSIDYTAYTLVA